MVPPVRSRSVIGRANLAKSKRAERAVVGYYRATLWPHAERTVRTGYRTSDRTGADLGDVTGTPGVATQIKTTASNPDPRIPGWLADTEEQRAAAQATLGVLVVARPGHADPGTWWAHLRLSTLAELLGAPAHALGLLAGPLVGDVATTLASTPVRLDLASLVLLLRHNGYGTPLPADLVHGAGTQGALLEIPTIEVLS